MPQKLPSIDEIGRLSASGLTYARIAEQFGVTKGAVSRAMERAGRHSSLPRPTLEERFWAKVSKTEDCWLWTASTDPTGYGQFMVHPDKNVKAYRVAYELRHGPVPAGLVLDHLCRNHLCVNPEHLEPVTNQVNILRGVGTSARHAVKTSCDNGHEFTPENIYEYRGRRMCRSCRRIRNREAHHRRKERRATN